LPHGWRQSGSDLRGGNKEKAMAELTETEIKKRVAELGAEQPWNHNFELPLGVQTRPERQESHGKNLIKWQRLEVLLESIGVKGRRILDVGCNEGFFSLQLSRMGAGEVYGLDVDEQRIKKARFVAELLKPARTSFNVTDIYSNTFAELPRFDVCLCLGFLHRIPDPFTAMSRLAARSDIIVFEWKTLKFGPHDEPFAYYTPGHYIRDDYYGTQFWVMSFRCVEEIMRRLGFDRFHKIDDPSHRRAIMVAGRVANPIFELPDQIDRNNKVMAVLRHTKRYFATLVKIMDGRLNA
jgi:tRNA (mo5U34)-methyltransferase